MPFIGNQPALSYTSFAKQDFTTSATTSYTLDHPVTNENEIALFINFVRQEPTTAYSASGTSLTLTSATSASDDMYCVFLGKAVQTVNPPNGSVGLSQLSATGTKDATTFLRGDNTFAVAGGDNTPAFMAFVNGDQSVSANTDTVVAFNSEVFDTDNAYDNTSTNYKFTVPTGEAGKYFVYARLIYSASTSNRIRIFKNGSLFSNNYYDSNSNGSIDLSTIMDLSASDYIQIKAFATSSFTLSGSEQRCVFLAYKLIGV